MPLMNAVSKIAMSAAVTLALGTSAFAQTMVGGQEISDDDLEFVIVHCEWLAEGVDPLAMGAEPMDGTNPENEVDAADDDSEDAADASDGISDAVDIDAITMEDCEAAGLPPS